MKRRDWAPSSHTCRTEPLSAFLCRRPVGFRMRFRFDWLLRWLRRRLARRRLVRRRSVRWTPHRLRVRLGRRRRRMRHGPGRRLEQCLVRRWRGAFRGQFVWRRRGALVRRFRGDLRWGLCWSRDYAGGCQSGDLGRDPSYWRCCRRVWGRRRAGLLSCGSYCGTRRRRGRSAVGPAWLDARRRRRRGYGPAGS